MPALGKLKPKSCEIDELRQALLGLLNKIGVMRILVADPSTADLIKLAKRCELGSNDFVVCPELDNNIPF